jgi:NAD(P)H dehydrogenase (quinone)
MLAFASVCASRRIWTGCEPTGAMLSCSTSTIRYTIAMTHQTKTVVDAAKKAGVKHIVNQGVFAADDATDSKYCWFALVEAYIEASGVAWTHLHPNVFLENMLSVSQPVGGTFSTFWGENRVGYVALHDLAAVTAKVLRDGPDRHGSKDYYP